MQYPRQVYISQCHPTSRGSRQLLKARSVWAGSVFTRTISELTSCELEHLTTHHNKLNLDNIQKHAEFISLTWRQIISRETINIWWQVSAWMIGGDFCPCSLVSTPDDCAIHHSSLISALLIISQFADIISVLWDSKIYCKDSHSHVSDLSKPDLFLNLSERTKKPRISPLPWSTSDFWSY